jgi:hypothetical protein
VIYGSTTKTATVDLLPNTISALSDSQLSVYGGNSVSERLTLAGPASAAGQVVTLTSSNPAVAGVPPSATVEGGATSSSFSIQTSLVAAPEQATITASCGGASRYLTVLINPSALSSLASYSGTAAGGQIVNIGFTLSSAAFTGATVALTSSDPAAAAVPTGIAVATGQSTGTIAIQTHPVAAPTAVTITASLGGVSKVFTLTLTPAALNYLYAYAKTVAGGQTVSEQFALTAPAASGAALALVSSNPAAVSVPDSIAVAANQQTGTMTMQTSPVATLTVVTVTASLGGVSKVFTLTLTPAALNYFYDYGKTVAGGQSVSEGFALTAPAVNGAILALVSSNPDVASVPPAVTIAADRSSGTIIIQTTPVAVQTVTTITASCGGVTKVFTLIVNPADGKY